MPSLPPLLALAPLVVPPAQDAEPWAPWEVAAPDGWLVADGVAGDVDGDGARDLVLALRGFDDPGARRLLVRTRVAAHERDVPPAAVAFALGDVHPDPGLEVVLLDGEGARAWRPRAGPEASLVELGSARLLWQLPERRLVAFQPAVADLDGDGLDDLLLPELDGWRALLQRRDDDGGARFVPGGAPRLPRDPALFLSATAGTGIAIRGDQREGTVDVTLGTDVPMAFADEEPLLAVDDRLPAAQRLDWDADGDLDLLAQTSRHLWVWTWGEGGFATAPDRRLDLPVEADLGRRLDASYSSHALELDGDGRADCVVVAGDRNASAVRSQTLVFRQAGDAGPRDEARLFGPEGLPQQLLVLAGFVVLVRFDDVDGDGAPDLVPRVLRPDLIDQLRALSTRDLSETLLVFLNRGGSFSQRPDVELRFRVARGGDARFVGDATGDGISEVLVREVENELRLHWVRRERDGLVVRDEPLWRWDVHWDARLVLPGENGVRRGEVLVLEPRKALWVELR